MKKLGVIICNNGLGHTKRVFFLLRSLYLKYNCRLQIYIFVDLSKLKYFTPVVGFLKRSCYKVNFLNVDANVFNYEEEFLSKYRDYLKTVDYIWSDNLIFPLKYRKEFFLTGSFLWPAIVKNEFIKRDEDFLLKNRPVMIGNKYFAMPKIKMLTDFLGVGMYEYFSFNLYNKSSGSILLSCGKSLAAHEYFKKYLSGLKKEIKKTPYDIQIYVEPDYYEYFSSAKNIKRASYSEVMFGSLCAASIRPGLGTVNDVLTKGGRIFSFFEDNCPDVKYNARVLEKMNLGVICSNPAEALLRATVYLFDNKSHQRHIESVRRLDFNGIAKTISKIKKIINI